MTTVAIGSVTNVSFNWTDPDLRMNWTGTADSYEVRYRGSADTDYGSPLTTTDDTGITISGLTEGNHYDFEVVTTVNDIKMGQSETVAVYYGYTIPQNLTQPTKCKMISESETQCTVQFTAPNGNWDFLINWVDEDGNTFSDTLNTSSNTPQYTILNLDPNKNYQIWFSIVKGEEIVDGDCYLDKGKACCTVS